MGRISKEEYLERFSIHKGKYDYSHIDFNNIKIYDKIELVCPKHGTFPQTVRDHTKGDGCLGCISEKRSERQRSNTKEFIEKVLKIHEGYYTYPNTAYGKTAHEEVVVSCKYHGDFKITPNHHVSGKGCKKCNKFNRFGTFFNIVNNKEESEKKPAISYFLKLKDGDEEFYKIGLTTLKSLKNRLNRFKQEIVEVYVKHTNLYDAVMIEDYILENNTKFKYIPKTTFSGFTECFNKFVIEESMGFKKINEWK